MAWRHMYEMEADGSLREVCTPPFKIPSEKLISITLSGSGV
jgi:hypothetical protein